MSVVALGSTNGRHEMDCRWCGETATVEREIEPAIVEPKTKRVKKRAVTAWVCPTHSAMVDRNLECRETEKAIHRIDLKLRKMPPTDPASPRPPATGVAMWRLVRFAPRR